MQNNQRTVHPVRLGKVWGISTAPHPFDMDIGQDYEVMVNKHPMTFNCSTASKAEFFDNQDGTINVLCILKSTLE